MKINYFEISKLIVECLSSEHGRAHWRESTHVHNQIARVVIKLPSLGGHAVGAVVHVDVAIWHLHATVINATHLWVEEEGRGLHATWVHARAHRAAHGW